MSIFGIFGVIGLVIASAVIIAFVILLILGLCRASSDREMGVKSVVEDTGEYE